MFHTKLFMLPFLSLLLLTSTESKSQGFSNTYIQWSIPNATPYATNLFPNTDGSAGLTTMDINGDALPDLVFTASNYDVFGSSGSYHWRVYLNTTPTVGVNELLESVDVKAYPNPVSDFLRIELSGKTEETNFEVLDLTGRVVLVGALTENSNILDLSDLNEGVYLLQLNGRLLKNPLKFFKL